MRPQLMRNLYTPQIDAACNLRMSSSFFQIEKLEGHQGLGGIFEHLTVREILLIRHGLRGSLVNGLLLEILFTMKIYSVLTFLMVPWSAFTNSITLAIKLIMDLDPIIL